MSPPAELWAWIDYPGRTHYVRLRLAEDGYHPAGTRCGTRPTGEPEWPVARDTPVCRRCWRLAMAALPVRDHDPEEAPREQ